MSKKPPFTHTFQEYWKIMSAPEKQELALLSGYSYGSLRTIAWSGKGSEAMGFILAGVLQYQQIKPAKMNQSTLGKKLFKPYTDAKAARKAGK